jgi:phosphoglycerate kinase
MKTLSQIPFLKDVKVLVRLDLNVPIAHGAITDNYRIRKAMPTIDFLTAKGARVILISHIENSDKGQSENEKATLLPVANYLSKKYPLTFVKNFRNAFTESEKIAGGTCILLENLRIHKGEVANDPTFAKQLASLAEVYINEAFSVSHRTHASVVGVPKFLPSYAGLQFEKEIEHLNSVLNPTHPFIFILGGAKFETKLPLVEKFMEKADKVFIGGALANDFFKEKGLEIGNSVVSKGNLGISKFMNSKLLLPLDVTVETALGHVVKKPEELQKYEVIGDAGPATVEMLAREMKGAKLIVWNGPLGIYEKGFTEPTEKLAQAIAEIGGAHSGAIDSSPSTTNTRTILGGGDTLAAIAKLSLEDKYTFVSTGGGAMLDYLANETLPGLTALDDCRL